MPVAEILAGISLVKASVDFIKSNIQTAQDIGDIAGAVDDLFKGHDEAQKQRSKKSGVGGVGDQFGIKSVAQEVIDARIAGEAMQEMKNMINMRFGPDTWQFIVDERARRIQEAKEQAKLRAIEKRKKEAEFMEMVKSIAIVGAAIVIGGGAFIWVLLAASK
jgi:hypothetical protein|tara:strand:+ start:775 stop:1260 length:486 start_codon:yes stop_codon:yes gene_type:complete